jgi:hypothetical protein
LHWIGLLGSQKIQLALRQPDRLGSRRFAWDCESNVFRLLGGKREKFALWMSAMGQ